MMIFPPLKMILKETDFQKKSPETFLHPTFHLKASATIF